MSLVDVVRGALTVVAVLSLLSQLDARTLMRRVLV